MLVDVGRTPVTVTVSMSVASEAWPSYVSSAPPLAAEFSQPCPAEPLLAQGQDKSVPSPAQKAVTSGSQFQTTETLFVATPVETSSGAPSRSRSMVANPIGAAPTMYCTGSSKLMPPALR